jgi:thioredoxin reductase
MLYDVIIIGGGPAGLSAALILGRSRRKVLVCDAGNQRNKRAVEIHGYLTRDCIPPADFLREAYNELAAYGIFVEQRVIAEVKPNGNNFEVTDNAGNKIYSRKILIATGISDVIPDIPGIDEMYGKSVHHCPYCDGWEVRDKKLAVYAKGKAAYILAYSLKNWSSDVIIFTDGASNMRRIDKEKLSEGRIIVYATPVERLEGENGMLKCIVMKDGTSVERDAMFFSRGQTQQSELAKQLGCRYNIKGYVRTGRKQQTGIKGVFVAGDAGGDIKFVIVAAAEGAKAAVAINIALTEDERKNITSSVTEN